MFLDIEEKDFIWNRVFDKNDFSGKRMEDRMKENKKVELLAPAGSYESMVAAINAGADAVYLGGKLFGARAYANNLDIEELKRAIDYVHLHHKKLYLTVNTLIKQKEIEEKLFSYLNPLYGQGLDAVIVQDLGVFSFVKENFEDLAIHASTQMTLTGQYGAKMLKELGASRIVTARELSLEEIKEIKDKVDIEIEAFIHGALCYCYSGQCFFSSILGGRSGNRGRCAQPCRLPYEALEDGKKIKKENIRERKETFLLSPKDLCTIDILPAILRAGVYSLKIEGRMKRPEYTAGVVSIYRKYLEKYLENPEREYKISSEDKSTLLMIYNRGGFTKGYYEQRNGKNMIFLEGKGKEEKEALEKKERLFEEIKEKFLKTEKKESIKGKVFLEKNRAIQLEVEWKQLDYLDFFIEKRVSVEGEIVQEAKKQPLTAEKIEKQIKKAGNTPFYFEELEVITKEDVFLSVTALNELRRKALKEVEQEIIRPFRRKEKEEKKEFICHLRKKEDLQELDIYLLIDRLEYFFPLSKIKGITGFYLDSNGFDLEELQKIEQKGLPLYYVLPPVFRKDTAKWLDSIYEKLLQTPITGFLVRNLDEFAYLKEKNCVLPIRLDYSVYEFNHYAKRELHSYYPIQMATLPIELNSRECSELADKMSELLVYGYLPMMTTAQCMVKTIRECSHNREKVSLKDRYGNEFPVQNYCKFCYNRIYNCKPLSLLTKKEEVQKIGAGTIRLDFTIENIQEAIEITEKFISVYRKNSVSEEELEDFTRGHFKRGIE